MTRENKQKRHGPPDHVIRASLNPTLDTLLALDRAVVELSMHLYNVPSHDRFIMREQNQRLHDAVRRCLPRRTGLSQGPSQMDGRAE